MKLEKLKFFYGSDYKKNMAMKQDLIFIFHILKKHNLSFVEIKKNGQGLNIKIAEDLP